MMELFTLGAGRGYTESDVRQQARALTGFRNDWKPGVGNVNFRYDPTRHDPGVEDDLPQARRVHLEGLRAARGHASRTIRASSCASSGATSSPTTPDAATQRALEQLYVVERPRRCSPVVDGDPQASRALRRRAAGEVAGRLHRRAAAPHRPADRHDSVVVARLDGRTAALLSAERRRLGRHALARHRDLARPLVDRAQYVLAPVRARPRQGGAAVRRRDARRRTRSRSGTSRRSTEHDARRAPRPSRRGALSRMRRTRRGSASSTP